MKIPPSLLTLLLLISPTHVVQNAPTAVSREPIQMPHPLSRLQKIDQLAAQARPTGEFHQYVNEAVSQFVEIQSDSTYKEILLRFEEGEIRGYRDPKSKPTESDVANAFNYVADILTNETAVEPSTIAINANDVHTVRSFMSQFAPNVFSVYPENAGCSPVEALLLIYILVFNDGAKQNLQHVNRTISALPAPKMMTVTLQSNHQRIMVPLLSKKLNVIPPQELDAHINQLFKLLKL